jgi:hypothetical protein
VAIHFRRPTIPTASERDRVDGWEEGPVPLPEGCYCGFMIGPESDHDILRVVAGSDTFIVSAGAVVPIAPFTGVPTVETIRSFNTTTHHVVPLNHPDSGANAQTLLHLIGLTSAHELAVKPRRAPVRRFYAIADVDTIRIPLGGRRHAMLYAGLSVAGTVVVRGKDFRYGAQAELVSFDTDDQGVTYHIGGTDHEELWPTLEIDMPGNGSLIYWAAGEIGG